MGVSGGWYPQTIKKNVSLKYLLIAKKPSALA